jgi:hypothetical protein
LADPSIASHLPLQFVADGVLMPLTLTTTTTSADYCASNSSETAGVGIAFTSPQLGNHRAQAFSTSTNSFWDVNVTVTQGQCSTVRLTCANGSCGDSTFPNFGYVTAQADRTIQACVRDYECEDGDRVSVDFGSAAGGPRTDVFTSQELSNAPVCRCDPFVYACATGSESTTGSK